MKRIMLCLSVAMVACIVPAAGTTLTLSVEGNASLDELNLIREFLSDEVGKRKMVTVVAESVKQDSDCQSEHALQALAEQKGSALVLSVCVISDSSGYSGVARIYSIKFKSILAMATEYRSDSPTRLVGKIPSLVREIEPYFDSEYMHLQPATEKSLVSKPPAKSPFYAGSAGKSRMHDTGNGPFDDTMMVDTPQENPYSATKTLKNDSSYTTRHPMKSNVQAKNSNSGLFIKCGCGMGLDMAFFRNAAAINPLSMNAMNLKVTALKLGVGGRWLLVGSSIWEWTARKGKKSYTSWFPVHATIPIAIKSDFEFDSAGQTKKGLLATAIYGWDGRWAAELEYCMIAGSERDGLPFSLYLAFEQHRFSFGVRFIEILASD
jgi:hypothetical protein